MRAEDSLDKPLYGRLQLRKPRLARSPSKLNLRRIDRPMDTDSRR